MAQEPAQYNVMKTENELTLKKRKIFNDTKENWKKIECVANYEADTIYSQIGRGNYPSE